jgi:hypothetical protein
MVWQIWCWPVLIATEAKVDPIVQTKKILI